jgi:hypothetical protein
MQQRLASSPNTGMTIVLDPVEHVVLAEGHDRDDAGGHVEQERAEVADQRDDQISVLGSQV